ncbi:hypothetical protein EPUS_02445 [Endocarpon pusillum Z07020]|uniref:Uncharacterized protein n=1 Tax=Endocarpon pusillum (strain Z07020 / HMAS-L-300199) TaxID=1263415 RepID=U1G122_ENDPU|nr:uncharacterized protein EPUS_02445 [Endocarpon pusillum Z07020]ERF70922.1 hypothetical protein EPUS_02445 [Endocarpon pusillum Z07020]
MAPFWTDERDKTLLLLMLGPDRIITRAQAAEIAQMMGAPAAEQSGLAWSFASFLTRYYRGYFDFPLTNFESSHHPALLHISNPATSPCLSLYGTMLETDAFYCIFLTQPHLSPKLGLPRLHKNWALRHQETRATPINPTTSLLLLILATPLPCDFCRLSKDSTELIMPGPWDHETDRKLLPCLVDPNLKPKWADVATDMGSGFTSESVRYVFWKVVE